VVRVDWSPSRDTLHGNEPVTEPRSPVFVVFANICLKRDQASEVKRATNSFLAEACAENEVEHFANWNLVLIPQAIRRITERRYVVDVRE